MVDFRELEVGEQLLFYSNDFDGKMEFTGTVSSVDGDHAILKDAEGFDWWIDEDTADQFFRPEETRRLREILLKSRQAERCCRAQPAPFTIHGELGSYNFFVERLYPGKRGTMKLGPVIYMGDNKQTQEFANILNFDRTGYRDRLLACTEMRRSLEIRVMEGKDYSEENVAVEYAFLTEKIEERSILVKTEMSKLHYYYDEDRSDDSLHGEKVYVSGVNYGSLRFDSDTDTMGWLRNNPDIPMEHRRELYEQTKPDRMEQELRQRKEAQRLAKESAQESPLEAAWESPKDGRRESKQETQDVAIAINIPDSGYAALFSPNMPKRQGRIRR